MDNKCPSCQFVLVDNDKPLDVLKMLRQKKKNGDDRKYSLLVADFYCKKCNNNLHVKWVDLDRDLNVMKCASCSAPLYSSIFLGVMNGFNLQSFCINCYHKLNSGNVMVQK